MQCAKNPFCLHTRPELLGLPASTQHDHPGRPDITSEIVWSSLQLYLGRGIRICATFFFSSLISQGCLSKQLLHVRRSHMAQRWWCQTQQKRLHKKHLCSTRRSPHTPHRACSHAVGGLQPCRRTWQQGWIHKFGGFRSRCIMRHFRRCPRPVHKSLDHATRSSSMIDLKCSK